MKKERLAAVRGMNDLLPADAPLWETFEARAIDVLRAYGYQQVRTPIVEHTALFTRGIGEVTDIVEKEMYSFVDQLNGENLTLRPEATASVVRACIERPVRVATRLGVFGQVLNATAPRLAQFVMNTAFRMFPDSEAARGRRGEVDDSLSAEAVAMQQVMRGIHF